MSDRRKGFSVDEHDGTLRFKNGADCGNVHKEVDGYYVWWPRPNSGCWTSAHLHAIAELLDEMNAEWDEQVRNDPVWQPPTDPESDPVIRR